MHHHKHSQQVGLPGKTIAASALLPRIASSTAESATYIWKDLREVSPTAFQILLHNCRAIMTQLLLRRENHLC
jgi:hypothetical protein